MFVAESAMNVSLVNHSLADLGALAEYGHTRQEMANAFQCPDRLPHRREQTCQPPGHIVKHCVQDVLVLEKVMGALKAYSGTYNTYGSGF